MPGPPDGAVPALRDLHERLQRQGVPSGAGQDGRNWADIGQALHALDGGENDQGGFGSLTTIMRLSSPFQDKRFEFGEGEDNPPTSFRWRGEKLALSNRLLQAIEDLKK